MKFADFTRPLLTNRWTRIPASIILWPPAIIWALGVVIFSVIFDRKLQTVEEMRRVKSDDNPKLPDDQSDPPFTDSDLETAETIAAHVAERRTIQTQDQE